jgi:tripartite-type tricarboxylate transporter receptor subunit TctC
MRFAVIRALLSAALGVAVLASNASAQEWPAKAVRLVVPGSAGVTSDIVGRYVAERLTRKMGHSFYVENVPGAGGAIAYRGVSRAAADGHTFLVGTSGGLVVNRFLYKSLPYDGLKDFVPVAMIANTGGFVISVDAKLPIKSVADLIAAEKAKPGSISYAVEASSALSTVIGQMINKKAGIEMVPVPYKEASLAINDTANGRTQVMISSMGVIHAAAQSGQLRRIAVTGRGRFPSLPSVPAVAETWPGFEFPAYLMLVAPAGTPKAIVDRMNKAMRDVLQEPETQAKMSALNFLIEGAGTPEGLVATLRHEHNEAAKIFKALDYVPEQ